MKTRLAILLWMAAAAAMAQRSSGYVFFAPGGVTANGYTSGTFQAGGGGDAIFWKGLGVNVELGALWPHEQVLYAVGMLSPGGVYYLRRGKDHRVDPFVNGGYTLMFRGGAQSLFYAGGGVNIWASRKIGVRLEFRDHVTTDGQADHYWGFRIGAAFR